MPMPAAGLLALLMLIPHSQGAQEASAGDYANEAFGVSLPLPEGWAHREAEAGGQTLHVVFAPVALAKSVQLTLRAQPAAGMDSLAAQTVSFNSVDGKAGYEQLSKRSDRMLEMDLPGLQVDLDTDAGPFTLRQNYLVRDGVLYILESAVAVDEFDQRIPELLAVWEQLQFQELTAERLERLRLQAMADRCGSEIDWAPTWAAAVERARAEDKPIMLTTQQYTGFAIEDQSLRGIFMDEDVIALVSERYVPFRLLKGMETVLDAPEVYGLGPRTFGQAVMIVTPDGEVLAEQQRASDRFLRERLEAADSSAATPRGDIDEAERLARRGEFARARTALTGVSTARGELLRASMLRRERKADAAFQALKSAQLLAKDEEVKAEVALLQATLLAETGDARQSRRKLESLLQAELPDEIAAQAHYMLGILNSAAGQRDAAEVELRRVIEEYEESRWAWLSAAALTSTGWEMGVEAQVGWPPVDRDGAIREALRLVSREPANPNDALEVMATGIRYLLDHQQADGSWIAVTEADSQLGAPDDFELAITALCVQALLTERSGHDREHSMRVAAAIKSGLAWLHRAHDLQIEEDEEPYYMDYSVWSRSYLIWCLVDAYESGYGEQEEVARRLAIALRELRQRQKPGGGWSYYLTGDLSSEAGPADVSISFTTATAMLAMARVREAGFDLPPGMLETATKCMQRMRNGDGTFTYMLHHQDESLGRPTSPAGEALRGPLCARAILRANGEVGSTDEIVKALDIYLGHRDSFRAQLGKTLMHTGPAGQGSHYLMFGYANIASAVVELQTKQRAPYVQAVLEDVMSACTSDGSFVDTMLLGRAYGTAMAVLAINALEL